MKPISIRCNPENKEVTPPGAALRLEPGERLTAYSAFLRHLGRSRTWGWRAANAGWLNPIDVAGRPYLLESDIQQFVVRAKRGEFSKGPCGAAMKASKSRKTVPNRGSEGAS